MRDGIDYEFTLCLDIGMDHQCIPSKDRTGLFVDRTFRIDERTGQQIAGWLSGNPTPLRQEQVNREPVDDTTTENFLKMIHDAESKDTLKRIGQQIKTSTLPESAKAAIRMVYKEKYNSVA